MDYFTALLFYCSLKDDGTIFFEIALFYLEKSRSVALISLLGHRRTVITHLSLINVATAMIFMH